MWTRGQCPAAPPKIKDRLLIFGGAESVSTHVIKALTVFGMVPPYRTIFINANDNKAFVAANDDFAGQTAIAA